MSGRTARGYNRAAIPRTSERRNIPFYLICVPHIQWREFDPNGLRH
jgi:hypothetical protein